MASNSEAEFKRHYTQVCHCEWSEDEFTRQTTSENCVMHGNVPDPLAALLVERQQDKERIEELSGLLGRMLALIPAAMLDTKEHERVVWAERDARRALAGDGPTPEEDAMGDHPDAPGAAALAVEEDAPNE